MKNGTYPYYDVPDLRTLRELVANGNEKGPDNTAFYTGNNNDVPLSFSEVSDLIEAMGTFLLDKGFSGDNIAGVTPSGDVFGLNSGEVVLNRAQVGVLGSSLQEQAANNRQTLVTKVKGTDLIVMLDRTGKMTGKGELMFWR
jgi:hypothetical protein